MSRFIPLLLSAVAAALIAVDRSAADGVAPVGTGSTGPPAEQTIEALREAVKERFVVAVRRGMSAREHSRLYEAFGRVRMVYEDVGLFTVEVPEPVRDRFRRHAQQDPKVERVTPDAVIVLDTQPAFQLSCVPGPPYNTSRPWITGSAVVGAMLTGNVGSWSQCSSSSGSISHRTYWQSCPGASDSGCVTVQDSTGNPTFFTVTSTADHGYLRLVVEASNLDGPSVLAISEWFGPIGGDQGTGGGPPTCSNSTQTLPPGVNRIDADLSAQVSGDCQGNHLGIVGVMDSGVYYPHPDLNHFTSWYSCVQDASGAFVYQDDVGHGTHVAGIIAAKDNAVGIVGVAPGARIASIKMFERDPVTGESFTTIEQIVCGLNHAISTRTDSDPTNNIWAVNMSFGGPGVDDENCGANLDLYGIPVEGDNAPIHQAVCRAANAGLVLVAAAGNNNQALGNVVPASYKEVLTVTSMADFNGLGGGGAASTCGTGVDDHAYTMHPLGRASNYATASVDIPHTIAAPGVCVLSTTLGGGYGFDTGTSMAAPHVTGTVLLCYYGGTTYPGPAGPCNGLPVASAIQRIREDAYLYSLYFPWVQFQGDSFSQEGNRFFGNLVTSNPY